MSGLCTWGNVEWEANCCPIHGSDTAWMISEYRLRHLFFWSPFACRGALGATKPADGSVALVSPPLALFTSQVFFSAKIVSGKLRPSTPCDGFTLYINWEVAQLSSLKPNAGEFLQFCPPHTPPFRSWTDFPLAPNLVPWESSAVEYEKTSTKPKISKNG